MHPRRTLRGESTLGLGAVLALLDQGAAGRAYLLKERVSELGQLVAARLPVAGSAQS